MQHHAPSHGSISVILLVRLLVTTFLHSSWLHMAPFARLVLGWILLSATGAIKLPGPCGDFYPSCDTGLLSGKHNPRSRVMNLSEFVSNNARATRPLRQARRQGVILPNRDWWVEGMVGQDMTWPVHPKRGWAIGFSVGHDASIAVSKNGHVQCVLELERWFGDRYCSPYDDVFHKHWLKALQVVRDQCECDQGQCPSDFEDGVFVVSDLPSPTPLNRLQFPRLVEQVFTVKQWRNINHHEAHALLGYHASPFRSALVVSIHGEGNDGPFSASRGTWG